MDSRTALNKVTLQEVNAIIEKLHMMDKNDLEACFGVSDVIMILATYTIGQIKAILDCMVVDQEYGYTYVWVVMNWETGEVIGQFKTEELAMEYEVSAAKAGISSYHRLVCVSVLKENFQ